MTITIKVGDVMERLRELPSESVHCVVTSPPYWGLRDYKVDGQIGLEKTPEEYVAKLVNVFREVRRVLRDDGTVWLNLGDSYAANGVSGLDVQGETSTVGKANPRSHQKKVVPVGLKPKDLVGIPWRVAFALQADGWYLRSDIIWAKPNPMPESVRDRPTKAHEYIFLLTKSARYFFDQEAVRETVAPDSAKRYEYAFGGPKNEALKAGDKPTAVVGNRVLAVGRNIRSVWTMTTKPYSEAHFATFPPELPERCIKAGTSLKGCCPKCGAPWERIISKVRPDGWQDEGPQSEHDKELREMSKEIYGGNQKSRSITDIYGRATKSEIKTKGWQPTCECEKAEPIPCVVLDIFAGSGTTGMVAKQLGRDSILIELNPEYERLIRMRTGMGVRSGPLDAVAEGA